jgi:hypothetical protein
LKKRKPVTSPASSALKRTPRTRAALSVLLTVSGTSVGEKKVVEGAAGQALQSTVEGAASGANSTAEQMGHRARRGQGTQQLFTPISHG